MNQVVKQTQPVNGKLLPHHVRSKNASSTSQEISAVLMQHAHGMDITVVLTRQSNVQEEEFLKHHLHRERFQKSQLSRKSCSDKLNALSMNQLKQLKKLNAP